MSLDRLIGLVAGGERLAAALDIIRNVGGDTRPAGIDRSLPQAPGMVKPSADMVPAGPAIPEDASQAAADTDPYAQAALPASRSLLGLRPPLLEGLRTTMPGQGQRPASTTSAGTGTSAGTTAAAHVAAAGEPSSAASSQSQAIGAFDPVLASSEAGAADLPMYSPASSQAALPSAVDDGSLLGNLVARMVEAAEDGTPAMAAGEGLADVARSSLAGEAGSATPAAHEMAARDPRHADGAAAAPDARTADAPDQMSTRSAPTGTATTADSTTLASASAARAQVSAPAINETSRPEAALRDPLGFAAMPGGTALPERAGVIASFVLNAAMIPGWPPPRPIESARPDAAVAVRQLQAGVDETETADYLTRLGIPASLMARLAAWLEAFKRRARILFGLMILIGSTHAVLRSLKEEEDEPDEDELIAPDGRTRLFLR
jgi:hypothetical protein